ncbi:glutamine amidotransferase-related protein [Kitasatospora sp. NBC_01539]|uniref:glutamine amidotransferase-related protein n=1 Tax=Kitasatospora sp. NBC_01539 TaxID=2903577 RepID=UPI003860197E
MTLTAGPGPRLALVGDHGKAPAHPRLDAIRAELGVDSEWVPTDTITGPESLAGFDGIWVVPGSPYENKDGVLAAIRLARETGIPYLGTCGGFQHALIEYARTVVGLEDADDVQYDPDAATPLIVPLSCCLAGEQAPLLLTADSRLAAVYDGAGQTTETYHCKYGLNTAFIEQLTDAGVLFSGWDTEGAPRAAEVPGHPFFVGTLFQPELVSSPGNIHPLIQAFTAAVSANAAVTT